MCVLRGSLNDQHFVEKLEAATLLSPPASTLCDPATGSDNHGHAN
jgi:hypothetical protein